jgi:hypothetical protein
MHLNHLEDLVKPRCSTPELLLEQVRDGAEETTFLGLGGAGEAQGIEYLQGSMKTLGSVSSTAKESVFEASSQVRLRLLAWGSHTCNSATLV